uniref:Uncharacterized protein n=1 Tax=Nomascus leucogenys TaxID=61853 RepID=A0A2I3FRF6_NOMLE
MEIKKETMRKPKHWQTPHFPENTVSLVCQLGSDGNRSLTQHTFIALLLHPKKCTKIRDCVTQQRKRLISGKPPCLGGETEYQHKVVKSYEGGECHESMEEGF